MNKRLNLQMISAIILCIFILACTGKKTNAKQSLQSENKAMNAEDRKETHSLISLDITKEYPKRDFIIQEIADIDYIPLETTDNVLLDRTALSELAISENLIVTCNKNSGSVFVFDRSGKIHHTFNHRGGGGNEYQSIVRYSVDFVANEIFIWDFYTRYRIIVYSLEGDFKRILNLKAKLWSGLMVDYDEELLFCYDIYNLDNTEERGNLNNRPYSLISKKTGQSYPLNLLVKNRIDNCLHIPQRESYIVGIFPVLKSSEGIILSDFALDTVYSYKDGILQPVALRNRESKSDDAVALVSILLNTKKYILWDIVKKKIVNNRLEPERQILIQERSTGDIWQPAFYNADYMPKQRINIPDAYKADLPENCARRSLSAEMLVELYQKGKLTGKLKMVASRLKEDDNPVLMLVKFKE